MQPSYSVKATACTELGSLHRTWYGAGTKQTRPRSSAGMYFLFRLCFRRAYAEFASAIQLVVEAVFFQQLVSSVLQSAFPPILFPEYGAGIAVGGPASRLEDLLQTFPPRGGEGGGKHGKAMFRSMAGRLPQPQVEALQATPAAFRLILQPLHGAQPVRMVIIGIDEVEAQRPYEAYRLVFPYLILLLRIDIGVAIEHGGADAVLQHALDDGRRARCAARVQQHPVVSVGRLNFQHYTFGFIFPFTGRPSGHAVMNGKSGDLSNPGTPLSDISDSADAAIAGRHTGYSFNESNKKRL